MSRYRSRFYQISLVFAAIMLFFSLHSLSNFALRGKILTFERSLNFSVYAVSAICFLILIGFTETRLTRIVQVVVLIVSGVLITVFVTPGEIGGDLLFVVAAFVAYKYRLMDTQILLKLSLMIGVLVVTRVFLVFTDDNLSIHKTIAQAIFSASAIPILYWVFEDETRRVSRQKKELERRVTADRPFVEFGKNVGGIIHDFKNDLSLFSMFGQLLQLNIGETITERQVEEFQDYVRRFSSRIERILLITRIGGDDNPRKTDLLPLIRSVLYVFQTNLDFRRIVNFDVDLPDQKEPDLGVYVETIPLEVVSILENVIRNSCEALVEYYGNGTEAVSPALLSVQCRDEGAEILVIVEDNGPGISSCSHCKENNCLECSQFEIGVSSKKNGNGFGLINVRSSARRIGASMTMTSRDDQGVRTEFRFPKSGKLTVEFTPEYTHSNQNR